ncbi:hypothetical protein [Lacipirellula parvula]|uniref:PEP-CTERM protein-sorting domain-containing protein n=1 Tax=Lacipirellula parvula TaxID=2650471 RepID=A0A5K7XGS5_9BACT|nr:hypothetical protein [Lacipirellula parvula]BBO35242.1 hypothetical protein PLANPX_4854 [Lacipirellula parvula]
MKRRFCLMALLAMFVPSVTHAAVTMSFSAGNTPPTVGPLDQYNFLSDATVPGGSAPGGGTYNSQNYSDNGGPPGQTFRTPAGATPYKLQAISLLAVGDGGGGVFDSGTWSLRVSSVAGTTLTPIATLTGIANLGSNANDKTEGWLKFSLTGADSPTLNPNADYAFELFSANGWQGFDATQSDAGYANGTAFNSAGGARSFADATLGNLANHGYDRTFHVALSAVPEPAAGLLAVVGLVGLLANRRRLK